MRANLIELPAPVSDHHPAFPQGVEHLPTEAFPAELVVEAFHVTILPGAARIDVYFSALGFRNLKGLEILCHQALQVWAVLPSERIDKLIDRRHELGEVLEMSVA